MPGYEILPARLAVHAMRKSGYRDTAHAIAELIDNSIQAGLECNDYTNIEVIAIDTCNYEQHIKRRQIGQIAVYDNACGMDADLLRIALQFGNGAHLLPEEQHGIGKFGMGLPNASISQCKKVEVWSWQNGQCLYTYLDVGQIEDGDMTEVPKPTKAKIPSIWRDLISDEITDHGTIVAWSILDRVKLKQSQSLFRHIEFLVGRMYRHFLKSGKTKITLTNYENKAGKVQLVNRQPIKINDCLYLMSGTVDPEPYCNEPAFDLFSEHDIKVALDGKEYIVKLKFSIAKLGTREQGGSSPIGKLAAKNRGVSVIRADRELEMNKTFDISYDPRERWWGVEVSFSPELDDIFGVSNTKQAATEFYNMSMTEDAEAEGMTRTEYSEVLAETSDSRLVIYKISDSINKTLATIRNQIQAQAKGTRKRNQNIPAPGSAEEIATRATKKRRELVGDKGKSDKEEDLPIEERRQLLATELEEEGHNPREAQQIAVDLINDDKIQYMFQEAQVPGPSMFDVRFKAGKIIIVLNTNHPATTGLFQLLREEDGINDTPALKVLKLLFTAWARLEDEAEEEGRQYYEEVRTDWGRMAKLFMREAEE